MRYTGTDEIYKKRAAMRDAALDHIKQLMSREILDTAKQIKCRIKGLAIRSLYPRRSNLRRNDVE